MKIGRLRSWFVRASALMRRRRRDDELSAELDAHIQSHVDDNIRAGMSPDDARRGALIAFGGLAHTIEDYREQRHLPFVEKTTLDLRYAIRMLARTPGFSLIAVATLALGIGANTAIFSVINAVLIEPLPFRDPSRLVALWEENARRPGRANVVGPANFVRWRERATSFESMGAFTGVRGT